MAVGGNQRALAVGKGQNSASQGVAAGPLAWFYFYFNQSKTTEISFFFLSPPGMVRISLQVLVALVGVGIASSEDGPLVPMAASQSKEIERLQMALQVLADENTALRMRLAEKENIGEVIAFRGNSSFDPFSFLNRSSERFWSNETAMLDAEMYVASAVVPPIMGTSLACLFRLNSHVPLLQASCWALWSQFPSLGPPRP
jgi:hypothetical protein